MPYIGKAPISGGFHKLDSLTASATATYALTLNSAAYYPETANQLLVSLNGVIQAPQDSFTVSGSNLVFDSALTASDSIDFVVALGDVLGVGSVSDGSITTAKIGNGAVTDAKIDTMAASKLTGSLSSSIMPTGSVLQVVSHVEDGLTSFTNQTSAGTHRLLLAANAADSTSHVSVAITPSSTSSKILLLAHVMYEGTTAPHEYLWSFHRDTTFIGAPASGSNRRRGISSAAENYSAAQDTSSTPESVSYQFVDSPNSTSAITYCVSYNTSTLSGSVHLNSATVNSDSTSYELGVSSIIAMEIAG